MSSQIIIPIIALESTAALYKEKIKRHSSFIYLMFCFALVAAFVIAFFVSVSISVKSRALIRPATAISPIRSLVNGRVKETFATENQAVRKGDILYTIASEAIHEREKYLLLKTLETQSFVTDLKNLIASAHSSRLTTPLFQQAYYNYQQRVSEATTRYNKIKRDYIRNQKLYKEKVIADAEFENFQFEYDKAVSDLALLKQNQLSLWQNELRTYEKELQDFNTQLVQLQQENENLIIKAPVTGNLQNIAGIYAGSMVFINQELAQISPDTSLVVEAYVNPNDIGLLKPDMLVRFQIDAFNYNQWGLATGKIIAISSDIQIINEQPVFKVRCLLDKEYLQLKNGYKGFLKKGMSLQARFMVTERTLWQLLFDKVDDWINPNTYSK